MRILVVLAAVLTTGRFEDSTTTSASTTNCGQLCQLQKSYNSASGVTISVIEDPETDAEKETCRADGLCQNSYFGPQSPYVACDFLPMDFLDCEELVDHHGDEKTWKSSGLGCLRFGGQSTKEVEIGARRCKALTSIQCRGNRTFIRDGFPCVRYNGHYFVTTLLFSLLLGFLGMDRFYLGHTGTAIGKLLTIGGIGLWWVVDIILLVTGNLIPEDGSNWMPHA